MDAPITNNNKNYIRDKIPFSLNNELHQRKQIDCNPLKDLQTDVHSILSMLNDKKCLMNKYSNSQLTQTNKTIA